MVNYSIISFDSLRNSQQWDRKPTDVAGEWGRSEETDLPPATLLFEFLGITFGHVN